MYDEQKIIEELESSLCKLESMGSILTSLCDPDREIPDLTALADLGRLISREAMEAMELLGERARNHAAVVHEAGPFAASIDNIRPMKS